MQLEVLPRGGRFDPLLGSATQSRLEELNDEDESAGNSVSKEINRGLSPLFEKFGLLGTCRLLSSCIHSLVRENERRLKREGEHSPPG